MDRFIKILYPLPIEIIYMIHKIYYTNYAILCKKKVINEIKSIDKKVKEKFDETAFGIYLFENNEKVIDYVLLHKKFISYYSFMDDKKELFITFYERRY